MILVNSNEVPARSLKISARRVMRSFAHFEWLIHGVEGAFISGRVPAAFHGRRSLTNAAQRRRVSRQTRTVLVSQY